MAKKRFISNKGFSLLEMVVAIGIFSVAVWGATDIVVIASQAQAKASELRNIQDNIRFALEYVSKELRTGKSITTSSCSGSLCQRVQFTNDRAQSIMYCVSDSVLIRSVNDNCTNLGDETKNIHLTSDEVRVNSINFYVRGNTAGPSDGQPITTILMKVSSNPGKVKLQTSMDLQTSVTQRLRDLQ